jgi:excinuclease UvrABC nuclease subunit
MPHNHYPLTKKSISDNVATGLCGCYRIFYGSLRQKSYVGSSKNVRTRLHAHRRALETGKHKNRILNSLHRTYANECRFEIIFEGTEKEARDYEQLLIDFKNKNLYNLDKQVFNYSYKKKR